MGKIHAVITGISGYIPKYVMTNEEISQMVETSDEWIMTRIGIKERRILKKEEGSGVGYMAVKALDDLIRKTNLDPKEVEAVIFATSTPDYIMPNAAAMTAYKTGMTNAFCFDLSAACSGFIYALEVANAYIVSGKYKKVVVLAGDVLSVITNYTDRNTCPIFGDGCGAALLEATEEEIGIMDSIMRTDGNSLQHLNMIGGGSVNPASHETVEKKQHTIWQDGRVVYKHAVSNMSDTCVELMQRNNLTKEDIKWVVPHQANLRIIDAVASRMGVPSDKVMINIEKYGNTSAGTIPLCLWDWEPLLHKGDNIILTAFGAGFTWGATYLKWGYNPK
ncbi:3-oxoacyl-[acyl-carrier-protein] synthase 3 protein 2 [Bacteroidia bacterium]|nr:3-oxoacyl-[acyl-carrier-protein] synthase 3 protein 2 [Bacteroidia bacterium]